MKCCSRVAFALLIAVLLTCAFDSDPKALATRQGLFTGGVISVGPGTSGDSPIVMRMRPAPPLGGGSGGNPPSFP